MKLTSKTKLNVPVPERNGIPAPKSNGSSANGQMPDESQLGENHPLAHLAGRYVNNPYWQDYLVALEVYRREETRKDLEELDKLDSA